MTYKIVNSLNRGNNKCEISVIVPIYNAEKFLHRCIDSIVKQTFKDIEIILIDDGSDDCSLSICRSFQEDDNRIIIESIVNSGVSIARNRGLDLATGTYVFMLDSDDYLAPHALEVLYNICQDTNADLAICDFIMGIENEYKFTTPIYSTHVETIDAKTAIRRSYDDPLSALRYIAPWGKLYKRELFDGIRYPEGKIFEDIFVTHQILAACNKIVVTKEKLLYYFRHPNSIMSSEYHIGKIDYLEALLQRIDFFKMKGWGELRQIAYDEYLHALIWEYSRTRDILGDHYAMSEIQTRFRNVYKLGYASKKYPKETSFFLLLFYIDAELIILYWRVYAKLAGIGTKR